MWFWNAENVEKVYHYMDATRQRGICGEPRHALSFRLRDECVDDAQKCKTCKFFLTLEQTLLQMEGIEKKNK